MPAPYEPAVGPWYRFDRYEIAGGYIRPAPGAVLERYDPWEAYKSAAESQRDEVPPYQPLLELIEKLEVERDAKTGTCWVSPEGVGDLLGWCAEFGLLGILLHQTHVIELAPRWRYGFGDAQLPFPVLVRRRAIRVGGYWCEVSPGDLGKTLKLLKERPKRDESETTAPENKSDDEPWVAVSLTTLATMVGDLPNAGSHEDGELAASGDIPEDWPKPGVSLQDLEGLGYRHEPLSQTWAQFFPDVPADERETYPYPLPIDEDFWHQYAEPVDGFIKAASMLRGAILELSECKEPSRGEFETEGRSGTVIYIRERHEEIDVGWWGALGINKLVAAVSRTAEPDTDGNIRERWVSPSLIATFAMMAFQDLSGQGRVLECGNCGKLFTTKKYQAAYCSDRCRNTAQKRRYRAKKERGTRKS